jgi:hypothetical protein
MPIDDFAAKLKGLVDEAQASPLTLAQSDLKSLAASIQAGVFDGTPINVALEPGFRTNYGLQIKMTAVSSKRSDTLFRVYVPETGYPMRLDFYGEDMELADSFDELKDRVFAFMQDSQTRTTIQTLRRFAA